MCVHKTVDCIFKQKHHSLRLKPGFERWFQTEIKGTLCAKALIIFILLLLNFNNSSTTLSLEWMKQSPPKYGYLASIQSSRFIISGLARYSVYSRQSLVHYKSHIISFDMIEKFNKNIIHLTAKWTQNMLYIKLYSICDIYTGHFIRYTCLAAH